MMNRTQGKCLVIGLDGATPELVWRWAKEGKLPHLAALIARGVHGNLRSTYPPISAAAWVTFMTGQDPGRHGIFDFRNYNPRNYSFCDEKIVSSASFAGRTVWDVAGSYGRRVGAITVPITYPAWEVNGAMIAGYPTPDASKAFAYPPDLGQDLGHLTENSAFFHSKSETEIIGELKRLTRDRALVAREMLHTEGYDLFVLVLGAIDRAQHDFWKYTQPDYPVYDPQKAPRFASVIQEIYQEADQAIGLLLEEVDEDTTVMVMSDHGGGPRPTDYFHVNAWLRELAWLTAKENRLSIKPLLRRTFRALRARFPYQEQVYWHLPQSLRRIMSRVKSDAETKVGDIVWSQTRAYRFPMHPPVDGIVINLRGRQKQGVVEPGEEYETLRDAIITALRQATDPLTGESLVVEAYRREELYTGHKIENVPDIVFVMQERYEGGSALNGVVTSPVSRAELSKLSGKHRMDGMLVISGPHVRCGARTEGARIVDLAPTILYAMGLPVPPQMDGRVLQDLFAPDFLAQQEIQYSYWQGETTVDWTYYSEEEEQRVLEKLRRLGYVG